MWYSIHGLSWDHEEQKWKGYRKRERMWTNVGESRMQKRRLQLSLPAFTQTPWPVENCASSQTASPTPPNKTHQKCCLAPRPKLTFPSPSQKCHVPAAHRQQRLPADTGPCLAATWVAVWLWAVPKDMPTSRLWTSAPANTMSVF